MDQARKGSPSALSIKAYALSVQLATKYVQAAERAKYLRFSAVVVGLVVLATTRVSAP
jgi:hypothetical protein